MKIQTSRTKAGATLDFGDFNVFVGGNAVGKTSLVLELYARAVGLARSKWFWFDQSTVELHSSDPIADLRLVRDSMALHFEGSNRFYYSQAAKNLEGNTDLDDNLRIATDEYHYLGRLCDKGHLDDARSQLANYKHLRCLLSFANCEARLNLPSQTPVTPLNQPPQDAANVLFRNRTLHAEISKSVQNHFGFHLALLDHARTRIDVGLSAEEPPSFNNMVDDLQVEFSRIETWKQTNFTPIQDAGHGIRSMAKLLMTLLEPVNQIIFIDEPEMHLYPAQKRWLGRQLVTLANVGGKQVFLVTHDPIVLQGVLDTPATTRVFRIDLDSDGGRTVSHCDLTNLDDVGSKRNQDAYLQALFYRRCIVVEGSADRFFYQAMAEALHAPRIQDKELGFIACGGKGASKNLCHLACRVGLKPAIIYDFDVLLFDIKVLRDVVTMLHAEAPALGDLERLLRSDFGLDPKRIKAGTEGAASQGLGSSFVKRHRDLFDAVLRDLATTGVFVVPNGTLESWAPDVYPKVRFAELAPDHIKKHHELAGPVSDFIDSVLSYIGC